MFLVSFIGLVKFLLDNFPASILLLEEQAQLQTSDWSVQHTVTEMQLYSNNKERRSNEPRRENTGFHGFRPGLTQTGLYTFRRWLEA